MVFKTFKVAALFATLSLLFSCTMEEQLVPASQTVKTIEEKETIITASLEDEPDMVTRTSLVTDETSAPVAVNWNPGDQIKIFSAGESSLFTSLNTEPSRVAKFKGKVNFITGADDGTEVDYVWGLYPYREDAVYNEPQPGVSRTAMISTTLPAVQTGKAGTFDDGYAITIGRSVSLSIPFKAVYSLMRFTVSSPDIVSVSFKGNNNEEIAGGFTTYMDDNQTPPVPLISMDSPETEITLSMADGSAFEVGKLYYIVLLPTTFNSGFTFTLTRADGRTGEFKLSTTSPVTLARNKFSNVSNLDTRVTTWTGNGQPANEIWYTVIDGTSESDAMNVIDWREFEEDGEQINPFYDEEKGVWIMRRENPINWIPDNSFNAQAYANASAPQHPEYIKTISLPASVTEIGEKAFYRCSNLEEVNFGSTWYEGIYDSAFEGCNIKNLFLPGGNCLGDLAFAYNHNLKTVTILDDYVDLSSCDNNPFLGCENLESFRGGKQKVTSDGKCLMEETKVISYATASTPASEAYTVPENATEIGANAFNGAVAKTVNLPKGLQSIGWAAFYGSTIESIEIPASVTNINGRAFEDCPNLKTVKMAGITPPEIGADVTPFGNAGTELADDLEIWVPGGGASAYTYDSPTDNPGWRQFCGHYVAYQTDQEIWFHNIDNNINGIYLVGDFGDGIDGVREAAFRAGTVKRFIPQNPYIEEILATPAASANMKVYYAVDTDDNPAHSPITKIPDYSFSGEYPGVSGNSSTAQQYDFISVPSTVTEIGKKAFKGCSGLELFPVESFSGVDNLSTIGDEAFSGCSSMKMFFVYGNGEIGATFPGSFASFSRLTSIGNSAFYDCSSWNMNLGFNSLTTIGESAFERCSIPQLYLYKVSSIGKAAFKESLLTDVVISKNSTISEIPEEAFYKCVDLERVLIIMSMPGAALTKIGKYAFFNCSSLTTIGSNAGTAELPDVTEIGENAFYACESVTNLSLPNLTKAGRGAFYKLGYTTTLQTLSVPKLANIGTSDDYVFGSITIDELHLPSIKAIPRFTFGYTAIKNIHFGSSLTTLGSNGSTDNVFNSVNSLPERNLYFEGTTPPTFGSTAFFTDYGVNTVLLPLTSIHVPSGCKEAYKTALHSANLAFDAYFDIIIEDL